MATPSNSLTTKHCARTLKVFSDRPQSCRVTLKTSLTQTDWDILDLQPWNTKEEGVTSLILTNTSVAFTGSRTPMHNGNMLSDTGEQQENFHDLCQDKTDVVLFLWESCGRLEQPSWWCGHSTQCWNSLPDDVVTAPSVGTASLMMWSQHPVSAASRSILKPNGRTSHLFLI